MTKKYYDSDDEETLEFEFDWELTPVKSYKYCVCGGKPKKIYLGIGPSAQEITVCDRCKKELEPGGD